VRVHRRRGGDGGAGRVEIGRSRSIGERRAGLFERGKAQVARRTGERQIRRREQSRDGIDGCLFVPSLDGSSVGVPRDGRKEEGRPTESQEGGAGGRHSDQMNM
jgi:hypothetical protein